MCELLNTDVYYCKSCPLDRIFKSRGVLLDSLRDMHKRINNRFIKDNIIKSKIFYTKDEYGYDKVFYGKELNLMIGIKEDEIIFFTTGALSHYKIEINYLLQHGFVKEFQYINETLNNPKLEDIFVDIIYDINKNTYLTRINNNPNFDGEHCDGPVFFPSKSCVADIFCGRATVSPIVVRNNYGIFIGKMYLGEFCSLEEIAKYISGISNNIKRTFNIKNSNRLDLIQLCFPTLIYGDKAYTIRFGYLDNESDDFVALRIFYKDSDGKVKFSKYEMKREQYDRYNVSSIQIDIKSINDMQLR